jgi:hypothetical protein
MYKRDAARLARTYKMNEVDFTKVGKVIGEGAHGRVYQYGRGKVIKFSWSDFDNDVKDMTELISVVKRFKAIPKIYNFGAHWGADPFYWVIMERLPKAITKSKDLRMMYFLTEMVYGRGSLRGLIEPWKSLGRSLLRLDRAYGYQHDDMHEGNVMFDRDGNPKLIDLESFLM